jgi:hypothetical protein
MYTCIRFTENPGIQQLVEAGLGLSEDCLELAVTGCVFDHIGSVYSVSKGHGEDDPFVTIRRLTTFVEDALHLLPKRRPSAIKPSDALYFATSTEICESASAIAGQLRSLHYQILFREAGVFERSSFASKIFGIGNDMTEYYDWDPGAEHQRNGDDSPFHDYDGYARHVSNGSRLFATGSGFLGLAPDTVRCGDVLALVPESRRPLVLRKQGDLWTLEGLAMANGLMEGELAKAWTDYEPPLQEFVLV